MKPIIHKDQSLIFDKMAITVPINIRKRKLLLNKINTILSSSDYKIKVYGPNGGRYKNNYQVTIHNKITIELSMYPINKSHNFLRLEYNPAKLRKEGRKKLRTFLIKLLGIDCVKSIYFEASVTRLDLTLDIYDMEPDLYTYKKRVKQSDIFRQDNGDIASQVIGSNNSDTRITMYNKHLEQGEECKTNYQRIEVRLRRLDTTMANLSDDLLSEIKEIEFYNADFLKDARFAKRFKREVQAFGINAALMVLDDNTRRNYRRYLKDYRRYPIDLDNLDFDKAHRIALGSLLHPDYRTAAINRAA